MRRFEGNYYSHNRLYVCTVCVRVRARCAAPCGGLRFRCCVIHTTILGLSNNPKAISGIPAHQARSRYARARACTMPAHALIAPHRPRIQQPMANDTPRPRRPSACRRAPRSATALPMCIRPFLNERRDDGTSCSIRSGGVRSLVQYFNTRWKRRPSSESLLIGTALEMPRSEGNALLGHLHFRVAYVDSNDLTAGERTGGEDPLPVGDLTRSDLDLAVRRVPAWLGLLVG